MIYVLTYNRPHRKTQDLLFRLKANGYTEENVTVVMQEWVERKTFKPLIWCRPGNPIQMDIEEFCINLGFTYIPFKKVEASGGDIFLIGGANLLPKEITDKYTIINAHTGYLPFYRGLDCVKWAIYNGDLPAVTTHIINEKVDSGLMLGREHIDINYEDSFHSVCYRVYETELRMLIEAIDTYKNAVALHTIELLKKTYRRMPHRLEMKLFDKFNKLRLV